MQTSLTSDGLEDLETPRQAFGRGTIFPFRLCCCLSGPMQAFVPNSIAVVQDSTHLSLIAGFTCAVLVLIKEAHSLIAFQEFTPQLLWKPILAVLSTVPNLFYLVKILQTYDEQILVKEMAIGQQKKELNQSYESLVHSIDDLLGKATESSATMAERSFESKRRDFQRFLEHAEARYAEINANPADAETLLNLFRRFVQRWLAVFAECSVDPINHPKLVVTEEELNRCRTVGEVASLTLQQLKQTEVRFISARANQDAQLLHGFRTQHRRMTAPQEDIRLALPGPGNRRTVATKKSPTTEIELSPIQSTRRTESSTADLSPSSDVGSTSPSRAASTAASSFSMQLKKSRTFCCSCQWLTCGSFGCGCFRNHAGLTYPRSLQCKCLKLELLSQEHLLLITGFCSGLLLVILDGSKKPVDWFLLFPMLPYLVCIIVLLVHFEHIDVVQRLEREVKELQMESERIKERREQMVTFWNDMQKLTDLWVHRTVPRLDLLKEVQGHLEYAKAKDSLAYMAKTNSLLEEFESKLPKLDEWRSDGNLDEAAKKAFGACITKLCQDESLPGLLNNLQRVVVEQLPQLTESGQKIDRGEAVAVRGAVANGRS